MEKDTASLLPAEMDDLETEVSGELAYRRGEHRTASAEGATLDQGKYPEIRKQVTGEWLVFREFWISSLPQAARESRAEDHEAPDAG